MTRLEELFRSRESMSGIFNWLIGGYRLLAAERLSTLARVQAAVDAYRLETDVLGALLADYTVVSVGVGCPQVNYILTMSVGRKITAFGR